VARIYSIAIVELYVCIYLCTSFFDVDFNSISIPMGGTRLKRKARRNKTKASTRKQIMKVQGFKPVIKALDREAIVEEFRKKPAKTTDVIKEVKAKEVQVLTPSKPAKTTASKSEITSGDKKTTKKPAVSAMEKTEVATPKSKTASKTAEPKTKSASKPKAKTKAEKKATAEKTVQKKSEGNK